MNAPRELVIDADGHVCEPADLWEQRLPAHLRDRGIRLRWNADTGFDEAWVEDWCITDRGLVGLGNAGRPSRTSAAAATTRTATRPASTRTSASRCSTPRGSTWPCSTRASASSSAASTTPSSRSRRCRVYNDWIAECCGGRSPPAQGRRRAADAGSRRRRGRGAARGRASSASAARSCGRIRSPTDALLHDPAYEPVWRRSRSSACRSRSTPRALGHAGHVARHAPVMAPGTHHALILFFDQYMTLSNLVYAGVLERHPGLQGRRARVRRRLDRALDGPPRRVHGELRLGSGT